MQELLRNVWGKNRTVFFMLTEKLRVCSCMCVHLRKRSPHVLIFHQIPRQRHCYAIIDLVGYLRLLQLCPAAGSPAG